MMRTADRQLLWLFLTGLATLVPLTQVAYADILYNNFSSTAGLQLSGIAAQNGNFLRLTPSGQQFQFETGIAYATAKENVKNRFTTTFQFRITAPTGIVDDAGQTGGDGLAFVIQNVSATAMGDVGAFLGYHNVPNSIAIEFDTFFDGPIVFDVGDPNGNHISVQTRGELPNSAYHDDSIGFVTSLPNMSDGQIHTAKIDYVPGTLTIFLDDLVTPRLTVAADIDALLALDGKNAFVGFSSSQGAGSENHDLLNWSFTGVPEPGTLSLLALAAGLFSLRRRAASTTR